MTNIIEIKDKFPFLSGLKSPTYEYIGIIQNSDDKIISFYDYEAIRGEIWWWESNRLLPINIFLQGQMLPFRYCMKTVVNKDIELMFGTLTSLNNIMKKRIKKRQIQLIRRAD
jgi:hypothetical protein